VAGSDLLRSMEHAVLLQRAAALDPGAMDAEEALELATREGAAYLGIEAGVLAPGRLADVVAIDLRRPGLQPVGNVVAALVYAATASDVALTIVDGQVAYGDGRCPFVDEEALMAAVQDRAEALVSRAGLERYRLPWRLGGTTGGHR
jgi:5-methylthioadenosine/S-adenosylhomocysteine deaminase